MRTARPSQLLPRALAISIAALAALSVSSIARASNVMEFPDNGSEQFGRGGAWVARASDPLATFFNPAGLAGQPTRLTLQNNFIFQHTCFSRIASPSDTSNDPLINPATSQYPRVCNDIAPNFNPQLAFTYRLSNRIGLGIAVLGPSAAGNATWPDFVSSPQGLEASPNRYMLNFSKGLIINPTIGIGAEVIDGLRLGASFTWGLANLKLSNASVGLNTNAAQPSNDIRAELQVHDYFVPGFTLGGIYSPTDNLDIAGWYKWSDAIRARGDVGTAANYYTSKNANGNASSVTYGDTSFSDCGTGQPGDAGKCGNGGNATLKLPIPMEAKLGFRFHKPRPDLQAINDSPQPGTAPDTKHLRDPMATDQFDVEADLTWANNSAIDTIQLRFLGDQNGNGILPVSGIPAGVLPPVADTPVHYKDVFGVRVGGDYVIVPDKFSLRGGGFFESNGQDQTYQNILFPGGAKIGVMGGGQYRVHFGDSASGKTNALDLMLGFGHIFYFEQTNNSFSASGVDALAGTACNPAATSPTAPCANGNQKYRTNWPINLGTITSSVNVINIGVSYKF